MTDFIVPCEEFTTRLGKLENLQGFSRFDLDQVLMPAFSRYPDRASEFVRAYAEVLQIEGGARPVREALGLQDEEKSDVDLTQTWEGVPKKLACSTQMTETLMKIGVSPLSLAC